MQLLQAQIRKELADAFKAITQGQKNQAASDAEVANTAFDILERGMSDGESGQGAAAGAS
jgi:hypothetical protein